LLKKGQLFPNVGGNGKEIRCHAKKKMTALKKKREEKGEAHLVEGARVIRSRRNIM